MYGQLAFAGKVETHSTFSAEASRTYISLFYHLAVALLSTNRCVTLMYIYCVTFLLPAAYHEQWGNYVTSRVPCLAVVMVELVL